MKSKFKSVKFKLFFAYSISIFIVLFLISFLALSAFKANQETKSLNLLDSTYSQVEKIILNKNKNKIDINNINNLDEIKNLIIIIYKNDKLFYTNKSFNLTKNIVDDIEEEVKEESNEEFDEDEDFQYLTYLEVYDFIVNRQEIQNNDNTFRVYIAINENILEEFFDDVYTAIILVNVFLFLLLSTLGYFLINKTIKPLKNILLEVKDLKNKKDLSKRLKKINTDDEFEDLVSSFNEMLEWIENSVENIKQFSSDASHELRTPLTVIQGEIQLCKLSKKSDIQLYESIDKIDVEQKNLQNIIKDFLLLSKLDKEILNNEVSLLDKVIFEVIEKNLEDIENKKLELKLDIEDCLEINFNEKYLYIVINNLLTNAIKYTEDGYIFLSAKKYKNEVYFKIKDTGIGIHRKDINDIFNRFYRVDKIRTSHKNGLGLGLSIAKKISKRFSYDINVKSEINLGSEFIFFKNK